MPENYVFADLVDLDIIQGLLDQFYQLTGMPPSVTDGEGNLLLSVEFKTICEKFHRAHPLSQKRCVDNDRSLSRQINTTGDYACYECRNGLMNVAIPIVIDDHHMANLLISRFFMDRPPPWERFIKQAEEFGFNKEAYLVSLDQVPVFTRQEVELAAKFLSSLARLLGEMALGNKQLAAFNETLEQQTKKHTAQLGQEHERRKQTLAELETIFDNAPVAMAFLKGDRIIHKVNDEFGRFTGYSQDELLGRTAIDIFSSPEKFTEFGRTVYPRLAKGETVSLERQFTARSGRKFWTSMHGRSLDPPHLEDGIVWFLTDITERKELEALKEDVERITRHDLKVPLNGIIGLCQSLLIDDNLTAEQREDIKLIEESGFRMNNQIAQSLELYKIETGTYEFIPVPVDMGLGVRKAVRDLSHKAAQKQVEFELLANGVPDDRKTSLAAGADPMLSHTLFSNLVSNAVDAAPPGTAVTIDMRDRGDMIEISVRNQGVVPEEIRDTFFDKYVTSGKSGGTGLGTYTAKLMAEAQAGSIAMETSDAEGTTITVRLPARTAE